MSRSRTWSRAALIGGAAVLVAATSAGCLPQAATVEGRSVNDLYTIAIGMSAVVAAIVWGLTTWSIIRYRRGRRTGTDLPTQTRGSNVLEIIWTAGPLIAVTVLFGLTLVTLNTVNAAPQQGAVRLDVEAFRWGWRMSYPDEGVTVEGVLEPGPEAVLPVGRQISIYLTSDDVIHSFFVPKFLYKRDAIPGHPNSFTLEIQQPGSYAGECAELCGIYHSQMPFTIRAVSEADYEAWLVAQRAAQSSSATSLGAAPTPTPVSAP